MSNTHATRIASHRSDVLHCSVHTRARADPNVIHKSIASRVSCIAACQRSCRVEQRNGHSTCASTFCQLYWNSTLLVRGSRRDATRCVCGALRSASASHLHAVRSADPIRSESTKLFPSVRRCGAVRCGRRKCGGRTRRDATQRGPLAETRGRV